MTRRNFLILLLLAKVIFCFISWYVIGSITKLGDTQDYLRGYFLFRETWTSTAFIMSITGKLFSSLVGYNVIANFPFMLIGFYGIYLGTKQLVLTNSQWFGLLVCLCFPSTLMWTSIHSKEAVLNLFFGVLAFLLIKRLNGETWNVKEKIMLLITFALISFFKPLYAPAVFWFAFYSSTYNLRVKKLLITLTISLLGIASFIALLYIFEQELASYLQTFHRNFSATGELTRVGRVWQTVDDFLLDALNGMLIAFVGPTFNEAADKITLLPFFFEGIATLFIFAVLLLKSVAAPKGMYVHTFFMLFGGVVLFFFAQYPLGFFNPGSALRYKQAFQPFLFIMFFYFAFSSRNGQVNAQKSGQKYVS